MMILSTGCNTFTVKTSVICDKVNNLNFSAEERTSIKNSRCLSYDNINTIEDLKNFCKED